MGKTIKKKNLRSLNLHQKQKDEILDSPCVTHL